MTNESLLDILESEEVWVAVNCDECGIRCFLHFTVTIVDEITVASVKRFRARYLGFRCWDCVAADSAD